MARPTDRSVPSAASCPRLLALLEAGDLDAALQAGLMRYLAGDGPGDASLRAAQEQLRTAWAARERHHARAGRLERQAHERAARRTAAASPMATVASTTVPVPAPADAARSATLPPAAAAALARARAKAAGQER